MSIKKMILVPADMFGQFQQPTNSSPLVSQISNLDDEMKMVLNDINLSADVKHKLYNQLLQKYANLKKEQNKPIQVEIKESIAPTKKNEYILEKIRKRLPKSKLEVGKRLMKVIENSDRLNWNDKNELVVDGKTFPNSNIESLYSYAARDVRREPPRGWDTFAKWIVDENVPRSAIGNRKGWEYVERIISPIPKIQNIYSTEDENSEPPLTPLFNRQTGNGKLNWSSLY